MAKLASFKTITVAYMANHQKLTPFKTPVNFNQIDSFQDPMSICSTQTVQIDSFHDPYIGLHSVFILHGRNLQSDSVKSPWETTLRKLVLSGPPIHSEFQTPFKTPVNHTSHSVNGLLSRPFRRGKEQQSTLQYSFSDFLDSFQDPASEIKKTHRTTRQIIHHHHHTVERT